MTFVTFNCTIVVLKKFLYSELFYHIILACDAHGDRHARVGSAAQDANPHVLILIFLLLFFHLDYSWAECYNSYTVYFEIIAVYILFRKGWIL